MSVGSRQSRAGKLPSIRKEFGLTRGRIKIRWSRSRRGRLSA